MTTEDTIEQRSAHPIYDAVVRDHMRGWDPRSLWASVFIDPLPPTAEQTALNDNPMPDEVPTETYDVDPTWDNDEPLFPVVQGEVEDVETLPIEGDQELAKIIGVEQTDPPTEEVPEVPIGRLSDNDLEKSVQSAIETGDPPNPHALYKSLRDDGVQISYGRINHCWKEVAARVEGD